MRRGSSLRRSTRLGLVSRLKLESLESRLLMHAGHDEDDHAAEVAALQAEIAALGASAPASASTEIASGTKYGLSSIPALNSLPGAKATIYLDFDGHTEARWGTTSNIVTPAYDRDGDPTTFTDAELASIRQIWEYVAEDYAPFNINVSTVLPASLANGAGLRVSIGGNGSWQGGGSGGSGYVNTFTNAIVNTVFVFSANLDRGNPRWVGDAASHESGHAFGLDHQRRYNADGSLASEYNAGPRDGHAPLMGISYGETRGLWWYGTVGQNKYQDDMALIARSANGFGYRADDYGNTFDTATPLVVNGASVATAGVIAQTTDRDYFSFRTGAGEASLTVSVPGKIANLDSRLELYDANGTLIATAAPSTSLGATIIMTLPAGVYRAAVSSEGNYGDVGTYQLTGTVVPILRELAVIGSGLQVASGDPSPSSADGTDFGSVVVGSAGITRTFTLVNAGSQELSLTGSPAIQISGANAADFSIVQPTSSSIAGGGSSTFQIVFQPQSAGTKTARISIASDAGAEPYTFDVQGTATIKTVEFVLDDGSKGFSTSGKWTSQKAGFSADSRYNSAGKGSDKATWQFSNLESGVYQVYTVWNAAAANATNAPYALYDNGKLQSSVKVNQRVAPSGLAADGVNWQSLGTVQIASGVLKVILTDAANGRVQADAVRIVRVGGPVASNSTPYSNISSATNTTAMRLGALLSAQASSALQQNAPLAAEKGLDGNEPTGQLMVAGAIAAASNRLQPPALETLSQWIARLDSRRVESVFENMIGPIQWDLE